jgi:hypothetical protein
MALCVVCQEPGEAEYLQLGAQLSQYLPNAVEDVFVVGSRAVSLAACQTVAVSIETSSFLQTILQPAADSMAGD